MAMGLGKRLDQSDYLGTPEDGNSYQIVQGDLYVTAAPTPLHQRVSRRLQRQLEDYFHHGSAVEVFNAPIGVFLGPHDIVEPDLVVVGDPGQVSERGIERAPLLMVEILSPSTRHLDRGVKARRYSELGVPHYWIVDPERKALQCYRLRDGTYQLALSTEGATRLTHPDFDGLTIDLGQVWQGRPRR